MNNGLRNWYTRTFPTNWYVKEWMNVDADNSDIDNPSFGGTKLVKGLLGKLLCGLGHSWEISWIMEYGPPSNGAYCHKLPYHLDKPSKNKAILLNVNKDILTNLFEKNIGKFECVYRDYN